MSYHTETDSISCTQLKLFCQSPLEYYETFETGLMTQKKPSSQMVLGTVLHSMLLEKKSLDAIVREYPTSCLNSNGGLVGKSAKAFCEKIHPVIAMKADEIEQAQEIYRRVMNSKLGDILRCDNKFEQRVDAVVDGVKCRCKPDIHSIVDGVSFIYDLKFTEEIHPEPWSRLAKRLGYSIQDAHYSRIVEAKHGIPTTFRFWVIEVVAPYRIKPRMFDPHSRQVAFDYHAKKLAEFKACKEKKEWGDNWADTLTIGPWDLGQSDDNETVEWSEHDESTDT